MNEQFSELVGHSQKDGLCTVTLGGKGGSRFVGSGETLWIAQLAAERKIDAGEPDYFERSED